MNIEKILSDMKSFVLEKGVKGAVVGISGGKDSTIIAKLMVDFLGKENVLGVLMPCGEQSDIDCSHRVVDLLGINHITVNIGSSFTSFCSEVDNSMMNMPHQFSDGLSDSAIINIAPRIRMAVLYSVAQSMGNGWRVVGTTNKSEDYIGWLTKWGDGGCDIEPIIDFTVTELRKLGLLLGLPADLVNKIPIDGLTTSSDEERFGFTYEQLDKYIETGTSGDATIDMKIEKMHNYSEHKRTAIPCFRRK